MIVSSSDNPHGILPMEIGLTVVGFMAVPLDHGGLSEWLASNLISMKLAGEWRWVIPH